MRILSLLVTLLSVNFRAEAQTWITYQSEAGRYRVDMPGEPRMSVRPSKATDGGTIQNTEVAAVNSRGTYIVSYSDLQPARTLDDTAVAQVLELIRDGFAKGHTVLSDWPITIAGHPGREFVTDWPAHATTVERITLVGNRLYQVIYSTVEHVESSSPDARRFLDSFTPQ
jgi:hypothetical protein